MAFDPDKFLEETENPSVEGFDPDAFLASFPTQERVAASNEADALRQQVIAEAQRPLSQRLGEIAQMAKGAAMFIPEAVMGGAGALVGTAETAGIPNTLARLPSTAVEAGRRLGLDILNIGQKAGEQVIERPIQTLAEGLAGPFQPALELARFLTPRQLTEPQIESEIAKRLTAQALGEEREAVQIPGAIEGAVPFGELLIGAALPVPGTAPARSGIRAAERVPALGAGEVLIEGGAPSGMRSLGSLIAEQLAVVPRGISGVGTRIAETVGAPLERRAINAAEAARQQAIIQALPPTARKAAEAGVLTRDLNLMANSNSAERSILKDMTRKAEEFSANRLGEDPALTVGNEFRKRIVEMEKLQQKQGQELGNFIKGLKTDEIPNVSQSVIQRMEEVPGLSGLKLNPKGELDFSETVLSGSLTKADREAIQEAFSDISGRTPLQLHKLRQEIFEALGGKKAARIAMTDTQDRALEAIRQGISDSLEAANPNYKALNQAYAKTTTPLKEMRRYFKNVEGAGEDVLDMKASLLARRLTSNAQSNPEIRGILNNMESTLANNGVRFEARIDTLQEFLNSLSRYFPLERETSLAGVVKSATGQEFKLRNVPMQLLSKAGEKVIGEVGVTPAVQQKYLKDFIDSLPRQTSVTP